jgi:hypothetical protein
MATSKYAEHFINLPLEEGKFSPRKDGTLAPRIRFFCTEYFGNKDLSVQWNCITKPAMMEDRPHSHDFDQFLFFYGGDSTDIKSFDAEVEMSLGIEGEKHIITSPTVLYIPKGMIHCPLNYKRIGKPIIFMNLALTPEYKKSEH